jgi:hypothetical protein
MKSETQSQVQRAKRKIFLRDVRLVAPFFETGGFSFHTLASLKPML